MIVGRCSEIVLKDNPNLISIFVLGDREAKIERVMQIYELDARHAEERMIEKDRRRKSYHNSHCKVKWGDSGTTICPSTAAGWVWRRPWNL